MAEKRTKKRSSRHASADEAAKTAIVQEREKRKKDQQLKERTEAVDELVTTFIRIGGPEEAFSASMIGASRLAKIGLARFLLHKKKIIEFLQLAYGSEDLGEAVIEAMALQAYNDDWFGKEQIPEILQESCISQKVVKDMLKIYIERGMFDAASRLVERRHPDTFLTPEELNDLMEVNIKKGDITVCCDIARFQKRDLYTEEIRRITKSVAENEKRHMAVF